ncbi:MAG TPA: hypothetical protein VII94_00375 [Candidatus Saccharimonadales bacterium]
MGLETLFPYRDMNQEDISSITEFCGNQPLQRPEDIEGFFKYVTKPMIENSHFHIKQLLIAGANACAEVYDIDKERGTRLFSRGAKLYIGVLAMLSSLDLVPCDPEIFSSIANYDGNALIWGAHERIKEEIPIFRSFLSEAAPALGIESSIDDHLAVAGAGLVHIVTMRSLGLEDDRLLTSDHPELEDMEDIFSKIEDEQTN